MDNSNDNVIQQIENNDFYKCFLNSDSKAILNHSLSVTEQVLKLGEGIEFLSRQLNKQVLENHDDLLRQANHATKLETVLNIMNTHIQNLFANAERLKMNITVPFNALETHTKVLDRLHTASHILRQVNRVQQLSKRLCNTNDPVQKASILQELEQLAMDPALVDVDAVTTELRNVRAQQQKVVKLATSSLSQGIINENETQTSVALQIFINLGTLSITIDSVVKQNLSECQEVIKTALEVNTPIGKQKGSAGKIMLTSSQGFRTKIWAELEKAFSEDLYQICKQIKFLQMALNNLQLHQNIDTHIASHFWVKLGETLYESIKQSSTAVQQMLEEDYPKLLKNYDEMTKKLKYDQYVFNRKVLKKFENAYLSSSLTRMLDPVQAIFNKENKSVTHDEIDSLIRNLSSELSVGLVEEHLSKQTAKNVVKSINMFAVKTEQLIETGHEAAQVIAGTPNMGQQTNVNLANSVYYLQTQVLRMLSNMKESLSDESANIISDSLKILDNLVSSILNPLIVSTNSVIETIIVTIHLETDWTKLQVPVSKNLSCSPYMKELNQFITRVYNTYLQSFENKEVLIEKCNSIAIKTIELFVRHSAVLRPISAGGRVRLQSDYHHLEQALKVICSHLSDLGRPYRLLKSMASLVVQSPAEIVAGQVAGSSVPSSTILLMLFSFADAELASPHQNTGWTLQKLSVWLDEHPQESDRLDLVAGALQRYESVIRQKNSTNYDPVYPIMSQFLETAVKSLNI